MSNIKYINHTKYISDISSMFNIKYIVDIFDIRYINVGGFFNFQKTAGFKGIFNFSIFSRLD